MLTSISSSNKGNIITYKNSTNNSDNDKNSGDDSGGDTDNVNEGFNEGYNTKMICKQDESGTLVNYGTITPYTSGLRLDDQLVSTSLRMKELTPDLRPDIATCIAFI